MITILQGDAIEKLRTLPDESVQCCVTSPPYWNLRDYKVAGQLGLEKTPEEYVAKMVAVFREVWRVLREDGTLWLNMGDSYANDGKWGGTTGGKHVSELYGEPIGRAKRYTGLKPKDLVGIPWMLAFALRNDRWYLRSDIIWAKPNPMPESVTDRPTKSHEYIFLLSKAQRYYYDAEAVKEATSYEHRRATTNVTRNGSGRNDVAKINGDLGTEFSRNKRTVWTVPSAPYSEAHFATFPTDLIKPCILAGTSARGCCPKCGAPWERIVEDGKPDLDHQRACGGDRNGEYFGTATKNYAAHKAQDASATKARILAGMVEKKTVGWKPACDCGESQTVPCTVLDPFGGSGTTGLVAIEHGRSAILIDINPEYCEMAKQRTNVTPGLAIA